jgi:hypothetical protein
MEVLYFPLTLYIVTIGSLRTGKLFYFAAANPEIPLGGFAADSKYAILQRIPEQWKPKSVLVSRHDVSAQELRGFSTIFNFPVIAKPEYGEGGFLVRKLCNLQELESYHREHDMSYIIQDYVDLPLEISIHIHVKIDRLLISGITEKQLLTVTGNGIDTVEELISRHPQGKFCLRQLRQVASESLSRVLPDGTVYQPSEIGNWNYGSAFIHRDEYLTEALRKQLETVNRTIGLFQYARYDIRCNNWEDLSKGQFRILEINGVKGEAIHIYDERHSIGYAYREIFQHWEIVLQISRRNIRSGSTCPGIREGFTLLRFHRQALKSSLKPRSIT